MVDVSLVPEEAWREAQRRAEVIRPLAEGDRRPRHLVRAAAARLGLSERQTYTLLRRCREGTVNLMIAGERKSRRGIEADKRMWMFSKGLFRLWIETVIGLSA